MASRRRAEGSRAAAPVGCFGDCESTGFPRSARHAVGLAADVPEPPMRVVVAMMQHETNTFSPVPTPLARFGNDGPLFGRAAYAAHKDAASAMGAFIALAEAAGAEVATPLAASAPPSGPVEEAAYRTMTDAICAAIA